MLDGNEITVIVSSYSRKKPLPASRQCLWLRRFVLIKRGHFRDERGAQPALPVHRSSVTGGRRNSAMSRSSSFTTCEEEMDAIPLEVMTAIQTIVGGGFLILAVYIINYLINKGRK